METGFVPVNVPDEPTKDPSCMYTKHPYSASSPMQGYGPEHLQDNGLHPIGPLGNASFPAPNSNAILFANGGAQFSTYTDMVNPEANGGKMT